MKAVVLAAGLGARLGPLTRDMPKPMMPIVTVPVIEHVLARLERLRPESVHVNLHYLPDAIVPVLRAARERFGAVEWVVEPRLTGPAGALHAFGESLRDTDAVVVVGGDVACDADLAAFASEHRARGAELSVLMAEVEDPGRYGVARLDERDAIVGFVEKPALDPGSRAIVSGGIYCVAPAVLDRIPRDRPYDFGAHLIPAMAAAGEHVHAHRPDAYWADIGDAASLLRTNLDTLRGMFSPVAAIPRGVDASASVHPTAHVDDDVVVAAGASVGAGAYVAGPAVVGRGCRVGAGARVERAVMLDGAEVAAGGVALDAVVAAGAG